MKKAVIYTFLVLFVFAGTLAGCAGSEKDGMIIEMPSASASPMIISPDPEDGFVEDEENGNTAREKHKPAQTPGFASASPAGSPAGR